MLKIYDSETARKTILRRVPFSSMVFNSKIMQRTSQLFGTGVTPQQATEFSASAELSGRWRVPGLTGWYSNREVGFKVVRQPRLLDLNERGRSHPEPVAPSPRQPEPRVTIR